MGFRNYFIFIFVFILSAQLSVSVSSKEKSIEAANYIMNDATWAEGGYKFDGTSVTEANIGNVFLEMYRII